MVLVDLFRRSDDPRVGRVMAVAALGGLLSAIVITVANKASAEGWGGGALLPGLGFLALAAGMLASNRWSARVLVEVFEDVQHGLRATLAEGLRAAPLRTIERLGDAHGRAVGDLAFVATAISQIVTAIQYVAFLASMTVGIGLISGRALVIWLLTCAAIAWRLMPSMKTTGELQAAQSRRGGELHGRVDALVQGFEQLKFDPAAQRYVVDGICDANREVYRGEVALLEEGNRLFIVSSLLFLGLGYGLAVFGPQSVIGLGPAVGYEMVILLALCLGPYMALLHALPVLTKAEASAAAVLEVLDILAAAKTDAAGRDGQTMQRIVFERARFVYEGTADAPGFTVGPIDLELERGDLVFVTGGNGSGKTTLMKMLIGLYPVEGRLTWDGRPVSGAMRPRYRGLFTAIFGGPYLFDRLYGLDVPRERVDALLERFEIADAVRFDGERFGHLDLSSGQRMRLAMVVALLEDRPLCVFDEWTAHQDPEMTWMYYDVLLPELIAQGRTVIAVSHDDRFFDRADHLVELRDGRVIVDRRQQTEDG